jgi:hypothetical protein
MPHTIFIGPSDFFQYLTACFFLFYFLMNILACLKDFKWIKYVLNGLDGFLVVSSVFIGVWVTILAINNTEEGAFVFFIYPILSVLIFLVCWDYF